MGKKRKSSIIQDDVYNSPSEKSPYWDDYSRGRGARGEPEDPRANPDVLPAQENQGPSTPQLIFGEAVSRLAGRQREVYLLMMREGRSLSDAAKILSIEKTTAQKYVDRAVQFIEGYCKQAIKAGRI